VPSDGSLLALLGRSPLRATIEIPFFWFGKAVTPQFAGVTRVVSTRDRSSERPARQLDVDVKGIALWVAAPVILDEDRRVSSRPPGTRPTGAPPTLQTLCGNRAGSSPIIAVEPHAIRPRWNIHRDPGHAAGRAVPRRQPVKACVLAVRAKRIEKEALS
jgi:hypothetical protein